MPTWRLSKMFRRLQCRPWLMQRKKPKSWCKSHWRPPPINLQEFLRQPRKALKKGKSQPGNIERREENLSKKGLGQKNTTFQQGDWTEEENLWKRVLDRGRGPLKKSVGQRKRTFEKGDWDRRTHVNLERGNVKRFNLWEKAPFTSEAKPLYRPHSSWIFLKTYPWMSPWSALQLALKSPHGSHHLLFHQIPGVSTKFVRGDALHILFCRGIYRHLLGSVLHYLCWFDGKGKQGRHQLKGSVLCVGKFRKRTKNLAAPPGWATFGSRCFLMSNSLTRPFPTLSIKGSEAKHLLPPCWRHLAWQVHARCMKCMVKLVELYDNADIFLENKEWKKAFTLGKMFLDAYSLLNQWASEQNKLLFNIVYKFHSFQHMLENSRFLNPRAHWCFSNQDFVGKMSLLTYFISSGGCCSWAWKWHQNKKRFYILVLTRERFQQSTKEFSDEL